MVVRGKTAGASSIRMRTCQCVRQNSRRESQIRLIRFLEVEALRYLSRAIVPTLGETKLWSEPPKVRTDRGEQ